MRWAASSTTIWKSCVVRLTSPARTQPVLPLGRTGRSTCSHPGRWSTTSRTRGAPEDRGLGRIRLAAAAAGTSNTANWLPRAWATVLGWAVASGPRGTNAAVAAGGAGAEGTVAGGAGTVVGAVGSGK